MHAAATDPATLRRARARRLRGLYALTPDTMDTAALVTAVAAALDGGAAAVQYRSKHDDAALRGEQARALARVLAARGGVYVVNDDPALAREVGADGVHLGADDASIESARERVGPERLVGVSCYADSRARPRRGRTGRRLRRVRQLSSSRPVKPHAQSRGPRAPARGRARSASRSSRSAASTPTTCSR
jgi:hypothetical protein